MFQKAVIVGLGLIGSSVARIIRLRRLALRLVGVDASVDVCKQVRALQLVDEVSSDLAAAVVGADLVVLAVPVGTIESVVEIIRDHLAEGTLLTDVGSVKSTVSAIFEARVAAKVHCVPAHPIAGTEHSGPQAGFAELFENRWCILTPLERTDPDAVNRLKTFWERCGSKVEIMTAQHHDLVLGITSHLPHLIAYTIVGTANDLESELKSEVIKYSAGGFRDFTRIAASNPTMWRDIFLSNRTAVMDLLRRFGDDLSRLQTAIEEGDGELLIDVFTRTREIRNAIVDSGQA